MSRRDFQGRACLHTSAARRLDDARLLLREAKKAPKHAQCAKYLAGYVIECMLKAIAMEIYDCYTLEQLARKLGLSEDEVFTHGLEKMAIRLGPLYNRLKTSEVWRPFARINQWRPSWRYQPGEVTVSATESATAFIDDVLAVYNWLGRNRG